MLTKPLAIFKRDLLIALSYKFKFVLQFTGVLFSTLMFFFLSRLVGQGMESRLANYGGDYFSFVLIGLAFTDYLTISLSNFAAEIRNAQVLGTLEALLVTPTSVTTILFSSCFYNFSFTSLRIFLYLIAGVFIFHVKLNIISPVAFFIVFFLTILAFAGIGLISASFIIIFKQGSPVTMIMSTASGLIGGVLYPVSVLPQWLEPYSNLLPITHALEAMRKILLNGATFSDVLSQILSLLAFTIVLFPAGLYAFRHGLKLARKEGSLVHY